MRSVQTAVLNSTIDPGKAPVFIIAPYLIEGTELAYVLSSQIEAPRAYSRISKTLDAGNNYFLNADVIRQIRNLRKNGFAQNPAEYRQKIRLLIEESMENGKLWGLLLEYNLFFNAGVHQLYDQAHYIFLYDERMPQAEADRLQEFLAHAGEQCTVIHADQLQQLPELVLTALPLAEGIRMKPYDQLRRLEIKSKKKQPQTRDKKEEENVTEEEFTAFFLEEEREHSPKREPRADVHQLAAFSVLNKTDSWYDGEELLFVFIAVQPSGAGSLTDKLTQLDQTFLGAPRIVVVGQPELLPAGVQELLLQRAVRVERPDDGLALTLNRVIAGNRSELVVIDNLAHSYSLQPMLMPFRSEEAPVLTFGKLTVDRANGSQQHYIQLADLLTTHLLQDNLSFSYSSWENTGGFDTHLEDAVVLWDFAIRTMHVYKGQALEVPATLTAAAAAREEGTQDEHNKLTYSPGYRKVIEKHRSLFQESLNTVIQLVSLKQHLPQHEIKSLQQKIVMLQGLLAHSKDELKALNELSSELQQRIYQMERKWYYRLGRKLNKIKKIFFKKQASGTGTLKRILEFFAFAMSRPGLNIVRKVFRNAFKKMYLFTETRRVKIVYLDEADSGNIETYHDWIKVKTDPDTLREEYDQIKARLVNRPKISIVMPVFDPPAKFLKAAIESVISQFYDNWELCIADDCSPDPKIRKLLQVYMAKDSRIKVVFRKENGHISASSNSALQLATGEYVLLLDHDDLLAQNCLSEVVRHINEHPQDEIIYSDEDKVNEDGGHSVPHFKPDWAPHSLLSRNYFGHVVVIKKDIIDHIGGFRLGFEGSQDYDLILRATEQTKHIGHIPKVLYHWRIHKKSAAQSEDVKPYAYIAARKALEEALVRRGLPGEVTYLSGLRGYRIRYQVTRTGKVSIVIPTKDQVKLLKNTIESIYRLTAHKDFEIIILNNNSSSSEFFALMKEYEAMHPGRFRCIDANFPFNFAKLMNLGVRESKGDYVLLLNNDVEIIQEDWITLMMAQAQQENTAAVGVKLLYPDDHIQHAGVIVGLGGVAGHAFVNQFKDDAGYFNYIQSVNNFSAVTAACMMFRKEVYEQVGGMNEELEVEYNDVDLCLRFMEAGYYNVYLPHVELYHYESATRGHPHQSKESWERHVREIALFKARWQHIIDRDPYYNPNLNIGAHDFRLNFSA